MKKRFKILIGTAVVGLAVMATGLAQTASAPVKANPSMHLSWDQNDPAEGVESYRVMVDGTGTNTLSQVISTPTPPVELVSLMANFPNGVYSLRVVAVNTEGIVSEPSDPLYIFWYGRPSKPTNIVVEVRR